jgi:hypothetical protein
MASPLHWTGSQMADVVFLIVTAAFFAVSVVYARALDRRV